MKNIKLIIEATDLDSTRSGLWSISLLTGHAVLADTQIIGTPLFALQAAHDLADECGLLEGENHE